MLSGRHVRVVKRADRMATEITSVSGTDQYLSSHTGEWSTDSGYMDCLAPRAPATNTSLSSTNESGIEQITENVLCGSSSSSQQSEDAMVGMSMPGSNFEPAMESSRCLLQHAFKYPYALRWSATRKATINAQLLKSIYCVESRSPKLEVFTIVEHIERPALLSFLQPGFLILSVGEHPLNKLEERSRNQSGVFNLASVVRGSSSTAEFVDLFYMQPSEMKAEPCQYSLFSYDSSIMSSIDGGNCDLVSKWSSISKRDMPYIPFCHVTLLSTESDLGKQHTPAFARSHSLNGWLMQEIFTLSSAAPSQSKMRGKSLAPSCDSRKFYANFSQNQAGDVKCSVLDDYKNFNVYERCRAAMLAEQLQAEGIDSIDEFDPGVHTSSSIPVELVNHFLRAKVKRSVDAFVWEASQRSQKFLQLFSITYSVVIICFQADEASEQTSLHKIHEYISKLHKFTHEFAKLPIYFVAFAPRHQPEGGKGAEWRSADVIVDSMFADIKTMMNMFERRDHLEYFTVKPHLALDSGVEMIKEQLLEDMIEQKAWRMHQGAVNGCYSPLEAPFPRYPVKFLACREWIVSKAQSQWAKKKPFCVTWSQFVDFIREHSDSKPSCGVDQRQLSEAISYFANSGFILTLTLTTSSHSAGSNAPSGRPCAEVWVLLFPQQVFVIMCAMMKKLIKLLEVDQQRDVLGYCDRQTVHVLNQLGVIDKLLWEKYLKPLCIATESPAILEHLGLFNFSPPSHHATRVLVTSLMREIPFGTTGHKFCGCSNSKRSNKSDSSVQKATSAVRFTLSSDGLMVAPKLPWMLYQMLYSLYMHCIPYYSHERKCFVFDCSMNADCKNKMSSKMASLLTLNSEVMSLCYKIDGVQPITNFIILRTSVHASKSSSSLRHLYSCFHSFLTQVVRQVIAQSNTLTSCVAMSPLGYSKDSMIHFEVMPICGCNPPSMYPNSSATSSVPLFSPSIMPHKR